MINISRRTRIILLFSAVLAYAAFAAVFYFKDQVKSQEKVAVLGAHDLRVSFYEHRDVGIQEKFVADGEYFVRGVVQKKGIGGGGIEFKGAGVAVFYPALENIKRFDELRIGEEVVVQCMFRSINDNKMFFRNCQTWPY